MKARPAAELLTDFENVVAVILEMPPYLRYTLDESNIKLVSQVEHFRGTFDSYCVDCGKDSTFSDTLPPRGTGIAPRPIGTADGGARDGSPSTPRAPTPPKVILDRSFTIQFRCSRNKNHSIDFHFRVHQGCFLKVGQFPSMADLKSYGLRKYRRILGDRHQELTKAVGLHAHGVGSGSFVYLRRIFETLIREAHASASAMPDWDASQWDERNKIEEKIRLLSAQLPSFLVENRTIYGILSTGIHELSEEECLRYFPIVRDGIEAILDERLAEQERLARRQRVAKALNQISMEEGSKTS